MEKIYIITESNITTEERSINNDLSDGWSVKRVFHNSCHDRMMTVIVLETTSEQIKPDSTNNNSTGYDPVGMRQIVLKL